MLYGERNKQKLEKARGLVIGIGQKKHELEIPKYKLHKLSMPSEMAKGLIESLLLDEGNSRMNMAINFSRSASQIVGQYYNFLRLGWEGYKLTHLKTQENARIIGDAIAESGLFDMYNQGKRTPILCYTLKEDATYSDGTPVVWNLYDLADRLQMHGWQVPAYPLPKGAEDVTVQRIVCRADLTFTLTEAFVNDFHQCLDDLKEAHVLCNEKKTGNYGFTY